MYAEELILVETFCSYHNIDSSFVATLHEHGLIEIVNKENASYIPGSKLKEVEQLVRLHNDLEISPDGLEIVTHLLEVLKHKNEQITQLYNKLRFYE